MRKRYYIMFVARDAEGELLKIPIPLHYLYVFIAGAMIGMLTITGMAGSYTRMLVKTLQFNEVRAEKEALKNRYSELEKQAEVKDLQVASLGSLASEVSMLYGLRPDAKLAEQLAGDEVTKFDATMDQLHVLRTSALTGVATVGIGFGLQSATTADWARMAAAPTLWPVNGAIASHFGERIDPFRGEGAFHAGIDIDGDRGAPVIAPADGVVIASDYENGYGRTIRLNHGNGISTLYGHLSGSAVATGQRVSRGEIIGYVGSTGRSTGTHLHYEVRINNTPVNPHRYLRTTYARSFIGGSSAAGQP